MRRLPTTYSYAKLSSIDLGFFRVGGTGLGNLLFPWAHFVIGTAKYGLRPIAPTWPQLKTGPLIRREADSRFYSDLFRTPPDQIHGIHKLLLLGTLPRISHVDYATNTPANGKSCIVEFDQTGPMFDQILNDSDLVKRELLRITRPNHKGALYYDFRSSISVHVRLGDFKVESLQTPLEWFVGAIRQVRQMVDAKMRVYIFSDGTDDELKMLLDLPCVSRLSFGSSIGDLLGLTCANILIANGGSTFSKWASYLGRMPVIWRVGTLYQKLYAANVGSEVEWSPGTFLPDQFIKSLSSAQNDCLGANSTAVEQSPTFCG